MHHLCGGFCFRGGPATTSQTRRRTADGRPQPEGQGSGEGRACARGAELHPVGRTRLSPELPAPHRSRALSSVPRSQLNTRAGLATRPRHLRGPLGPSSPRRRRCVGRRGGTPSTLRSHGRRPPPSRPRCRHRARVRPHALHRTHIDTHIDVRSIFLRIYLLYRPPTFIVAPWTPFVKVGDSSPRPFFKPAHTETHDARRLHNRRTRCVELHTYTYTHVDMSCRF